MNSNAVSINSNAENYNQLACSSSSQPYFQTTGADAPAAGEGAEAPSSGMKGFNQSATCPPRFVRRLIAPFTSLTIARNILAFLSLQLFLRLDNFHCFSRSFAIISNASLKHLCVQFGILIIAAMTWDDYSMLSTFIGPTETFVL